jgi:hypothetical protein
MLIRNFIGGKWVNAKGEKIFVSLKTAVGRWIVDKAQIDK